jgi:hypothetical protein
VRATDPLSTDDHARLFAVFDTLSLASDVRVRTGPPRDVTVSAHDFLISILEHGATPRLLAESHLVSEAGWHVFVSEHDVTGAMGSLVAIVLRLPVGPKVAFLLATISRRDPLFDEKRESVLAFARVAVPAWSGSAALEDLLWLPDTGHGMDIDDANQ